MPTNRLHNWDFHLWDGPTPAGVRQHVTTHTRAGVADAAHAKAGLWGDPIEATLAAYYATFLLANDARHQIVDPLPDTALVKLWWNGIDFLTRYQTVFKVERVDHFKIETLVRVVGGGLNLPAGAKLSATLVLIPHRFS